MLRLIQLEWAKFRKHRSVRVLLILYMVLLPILLFVPKIIPGLPDEVQDIVSTFYMFPNIFKYGGYQASWLIFFVAGFIGVSIIATEINNKTMRQNIITGLSRKQFFMGKVGFCMSLALFFTLYFLLFAMVAGFLNTEAIYFSKVMEGWPIIFGLFLQSFAFLCFALLVGLLVKRTGIGIFLFFTYPLVEVILRYPIHQKIFPGPGMRYYPFNVFEDLVPIPFADMIRSIDEQFGFPILLSHQSAVLLTLLFVGIILGLAYWRFSKSNL